MGEIPRDIVGFLTHTSTVTRLLNLLRQRVVVLSLAAYLLGIGVIREVELYAGEPEGDGDKDCSIGAIEGTTSVMEIPLAAEPPLRVEARNGTINDASCLNRTPVFGVVRVETTEQIREALGYASAQGIPVSIAGRRHSMGGQAFGVGSLVLDMRGFNGMHIDEDDSVLTVQTGATWSQVLDFIHPRGYSVEAMQAIDILTVGGSVAVNAHGIDHRSGSIASSIRSMRIMLADGSVHRVSRSREPELFHSAIGGYGLFGVILDVDLSLTENRMYRFNSRIIETEAFPAIFEDEISGNDGYRLMYLHLSTDPDSLLGEAILYTHEVADWEEPLPPLREPGRLSVRGGRFMLNLAKTGTIGERLKWFGQKHILPAFRQCFQPRNEALREPESCLVSRNQALSQSLDLLKNKLPEDTDILQEYFVPREALLPFLDDMAETLTGSDAVLLNASVRVIHREDIVLNYAKDDMFSVVLYLNQTVSAEGNETMARLTADLIDIATAYGGTFYLPYQLHYDRDQLERAYPEIGRFFALKLRYDPNELFRNHWYDKYSGDPPSKQPSGDFHRIRPLPIEVGSVLSTDTPPHLPCALCPSTSTRGPPPRELLT